MTRRGWSSTGLILVDEHERIWTVDQASKLLGKRPDDVRWVIRSLDIPPVGVQKKSGPEKRGRQPRAYRAIDLIQAYDKFSKAA